MNKYGVEHPDKIDIIGHKNNVCSLCMVQSEPLDDELTLKLQEKINNYLAFALDGQLDEEYPEMANMKLKIVLRLQYQAEGVAVEFLEKARSFIESEGLEFEVVVGENE